MINTKYVLSRGRGDVKYVNGVRVFRVVALRDIRPGVPKGSTGGYVASDACLSIHGRSWVAGDACVLYGARVVNDALVRDNALVSIGSVVEDSAVVMDGATVIESTVSGHATVFGAARIRRVNVGGSAFICGKARVEGSDKAFLNIDPYAVLRDDKPVTSPDHYRVCIGMNGEVMTIDTRSKMYYIGSWAGYENQYFERLKSGLTRDFNSYQKLLRENAALYGNLKPYVMEDSLTKGGL